MNEKNVEYLKENLKYMGFGDKLNADLEKNISQQFPEFVLKLDTEINQQKLSALLHFRRSDNSDLYFFNRWDASLQKGQGNIDQSFYLNKGQGITLKEGFNLLNGKSVNTDLTNKDGQKYNAWVQLDFSEKEPSGNYKLKQFHENYGYDLKKELEKYPIIELKDPSQKERLLLSLQRGNRQSVNMEKEGVVSKMFVEANPQFKSLNLFNASGEKLGKDAQISYQQQKSVDPQQQPSLEERVDRKNELKQGGKAIDVKNKQQESLLPKKKLNHKKGIRMK